MSLIGPLVDAGQLEAQVIAELKVHLPTYLRHVEVLRGLPANSLRNIRSYGVVSEYDRFPEEGLPALIVVTPGIIGDPAKDGEGFYRAVFSFEVSVTVAGKDAVDTRLRAQRYAAAVRGAMLQVPFSGGDFRVTDVAWLDEAYTDVPNTKRRTQIAASNSFGIEVEDLVTDQGQPSAEGATLSTVTDTEVEVVPEP